MRIMINLLIGDIRGEHSADGKNDNQNHVIFY